MNRETYHGVPRNKISWDPTIDHEKCISCGKCVNYWKLEVYEFDREKLPVVTKFY